MEAQLKAAEKKTNRRNGSRRAPRKAVKAECRRGAFGFGPNLAVTFLDISDAGVRLVLKEELPLKAEVEVVLSSLALCQPLKRLANVCWSLPLEDGRFCVGFSFQKRLPYREVQLLAAP